MSNDGTSSEQAITKVGNGVDVTRSSPYTLFSNDNPGAMITSVSLTGENYNEWASEMVNALRAKKKIGFVDGSIAKPSIDSADMDSWSTVNSMVVGWLRTSITPRVRSTVSYVTDAKNLWDNLKERFCVGNKVRVHHLRTQIAACKQGGLSVIDYYGKLAKMWDELYCYKPLPTCTCGTSTLLAREREEEKLHQFVMGLDESRFGHVITSIIDAEPVPDVSQAYSRVIREEQRLATTKAREIQGEAIGFTTRRDGDSIPSSTTAVSGQSRNTLLCSHCGKSGHEKSHCWQIIGCPEWVNERASRSGGRGYSRGGRGGNSNRGKGTTPVAYATSSNASSFPDFSVEQWKAICAMAQSKTSVMNPDKLSGKLLGDVIIDTGASHHY